MWCAPRRCAFSDAFYYLYKRFVHRIKFAENSYYPCDDRISHLLYADDLTLMAENENDLQTLINCVENWCNKWRMSVNHLKSKIVHFRKVRVSITDFSFTFQNKTVDIVQKYKYLGLILEEHLDFKASINEPCSKGGRALGACISKFKTLKDVGYITYKKIV